jgi:hypothetical protein
MTANKKLTPAQALANAARHFGMDPDATARFAKEGGDIQDYLRKLKVKPDALTTEVEHEAKSIIRRDTIDRFDRYQADNMDPTCRLKTVVRGHSKLDPMLNEEHPLAPKKKPREELTLPPAPTLGEYEEAQREKSRQQKKEKKPKGPGIIATILAMLYKASKKKPTTKDDILAVLKANNPERPEGGMAHTVKCQLNYGLAAKGHKIKHDKNGGYWAEKPSGGE